MSQVKFSSYTFCLDSRHVLQPADPDQNHVVLLQVVTLPGHVGGQLLAIGEPHQHALKLLSYHQHQHLHQSHLSISTVWLLGLLYNGPNHHPLGERRVEAKRIFVRSELPVGSLPVLV